MFILVTRHCVDGHALNKTDIEITTLFIVTSLRSTENPDVNNACVLTVIARWQHYLESGYDRIEGYTT